MSVKAPGALGRRRNDSWCRHFQRRHLCTIVHVDSGTVMLLGIGVNHSSIRFGQVKVRQKHGLKIAESARAQKTPPSPKGMQPRVLDGHGKLVLEIPRWYAYFCASNLHI